MKMRNGLLLASALLSLSAFGDSAIAEVPEKLNFQAILLDSADGVVPDGNYELIFRIIDDSAFGNVLWEETQTVSTENGLFNTFLGAFTPVPDTVFNGAFRWLEIQLSENPEPYEPRSQMGSVGYAFRVNSVNGATGGTIHGDLRLESTFFAEQIDVGDPARSGLLQVYQDGSAAPVLSASNNTLGSAVSSFDNLGGHVANLETDADGDGGFVAVYRSPADPGFVVDGNHLGTNEPLVSIIGSSRSASLDMGQEGDGSVALPSNAIASPEVLDEPGLSQGQWAGDMEITEHANMVDVVVCEITIPTAGYIVVEATAQTRFFSHSLASANYMICQIDEDAGGDADPDNSFRVGVASVPNIGTSWWPVAMRRTYFKAEPGTYEFRFEAKDGCSSGNKYMWNPTITASFCPTAYGPVETISTGGEAAAAPGATQVSVAGDNERETIGSHTATRVDLRLLQQQVLSLQSDLDAVRRQLLEAQIELQDMTRASGSVR